MIFRIGTQSCFIKKQENQYVKTDVFILGFPIAANGSMFVTEKTGNQYRGFEIKTQYSIIGGMYLMILVALLAIAIVFYSMGNSSMLVFLPFHLGIIAALILAIIRLYRSPKKEKFIRQQFYKATGLCLRPEWLLDSTLNSLSNNINNAYKQHIGDANAESALNKIDVSHNAFSLVFCAVYINNLKSNRTEANKLIVSQCINKN